MENRCNANNRTYDAQRNLCVSLDRKAKLDYRNKLKNKKLSYHKTFWKRPSFKNKGVNQDSILLVEVNETLSDNDIISEKLNNFFGDIVKILDISQYDDHLVNTNNIADPVLRERKI